MYQLILGIELNAIAFIWTKTSRWFSPGKRGESRKNPSGWTQQDRSRTPSTLIWWSDGPPLDWYFGDWTNRFTSTALIMIEIRFIPHLFCLSLLLLISAHALGQSKTTTTFHASGCCPWCHENIVQSLQIKGVIQASWDQFSETVTVRYKTRQCSDSSLQKRVAFAGHDTSLFLAPDSCYFALPKCCHYRNEWGLMTLYPSRKVKST